jgi:predicted PurR-regulated permease PerM
MGNRPLPIDSSEPEPQPDIRKLGDSLRGARSIRPFMLTGLFILALFYTLYFARIFLLPIMLALLFAFLLRPLVRGLNRLRIPEALGAALVLLTLLGIVGYGVYQLSDPAAEWIAKAPQSLRRAQQKLLILKKPVEQVSKATEQVKEITNVGEGKTQLVKVEDHDLRDILLSQISEALIEIATMFVLLYFLLASGDLFLRKLVKILPRLEDKKRGIEIARQVQQQISAYLFTVTMIYTGEGVAVGVAMFIMRMPNPVLWGVMAGLLEFIPYLGPALGIGVVAVVAIFTFDSVGYALLVPAVYLCLTIIQANFIFPMVLGRRLTLNPVIIFIGLIFWGWIWGIVGVLLAVPILMIFKILCDHIELLSPIGEFLGR